MQSLPLEQSTGRCSGAGSSAEAQPRALPPCRARYERSMLSTVRIHLGREASSWPTCPWPCERTCRVLRLEGIARASTPWCRDSVLCTCADAKHVLTQCILTCCAQRRCRGTVGSASDRGRDALYSERPGSHYSAYGSLSTRMRTSSCVFTPALQIGHFQQAVFVPESSWQDLGDTGLSQSIPNWDRLSVQRQFSSIVSPAHARARAHRSVHHAASPATAAPASLEAPASPRSASQPLFSSPPRRSQPKEPISQSLGDSTTRLRLALGSVRLSTDSASQSPQIMPGASSKKPRREGF
jgi:hypothetical protein